jgi:hypothetical protein
MSGSSTRNSSPPWRLTVSESRRRIAGAARQLQCLVADRVAERIVDALEMVEVDEQHGDPRFAPPRRRDCTLEPIQHQQAVRQVGQRIALARAGQFAEFTDGCFGDSFPRAGRRARVARWSRQGGLRLRPSMAWRISTRFWRRRTSLDSSPSVSWLSCDRFARARSPPLPRSPLARPPACGNSGRSMRLSNLESFMPVAVRGFAVETGLFPVHSIRSSPSDSCNPCASYVPAETPRHCSRLTQKTMLERTPRLRGGCTLHAV